MSIKRRFRRSDGHRRSEAQKAFIQMTEATSEDAAKALRLLQQRPDLTDERVLQQHRRLTDEHLLQVFEGFEREYLVPRGTCANFVSVVTPAHTRYLLELVEVLDLYETLHWRVQEDGPASIEHLTESNNPLMAATARAIVCKDTNTSVIDSLLDDIEEHEILPSSSPITSTKVPKLDSFLNPTNEDVILSALGAISGPRSRVR